MQDPDAQPEQTVPSMADTLADFDFGPIAFRSGTAELTGPAARSLNDLASRMQASTSRPVEVQVDTDGSGDPDVSLLLSQERAEAVAAFLVGRGVEAGLLTPRGYGNSRPVADPATEQGRMSNRRVALVVVEGN